MDFSPVIINQIINDLENASPGYKRSVIDRWSQLLNTSFQTVYRLIPSDFKKGIRKKGERKIKGVEDYIETIAAIKKRPPKGKREIVTEDAIKIAESAGLIPEDIHLTVSTVNRVMKDMEFSKKTRRYVRFQAEFSNQLHHIDASSSDCFYVDRWLPDGDYMLKLDARPQTNYKNKIIKQDRLRPWLYGLTDDHSGYLIARYVAAPGESMVDNLDFLAWAWAKNDDKPFFGLPEWLKADQGPMMKGKAAQDYLERLQIKIEPSKPYAKEAHGKIEIKWRFIWPRFERPFYVEDHKTFEIKLSELNRRFLIFQAEYNNKPHRFEKSISKLQAWERINFRGGAVALPENAIATVARRYERTVGPDGTFSIEGLTYEIIGSLNSAKIYVYKGVFKDKLVAVDQRTGERYEVKTFKPLTFKEYKAYPETPHQQAEKAAKDFSLSNTLHQSFTDQGNVKRFPTRIKETRNVINHLNTTTFNSIDEAMQDFFSSCCIPMSIEDRKAIEQSIMKNGLKKNYVRDIAADIFMEHCKREGSYD